MKEPKNTLKNMTPLDKQNVIDNFLFNEIMSDQENGEALCRMILERVLKRKIGTIHFTPQKVVPGISEKSHGIVLDSYIVENIEGDNGLPEIDVYDIEPDKRISKKKSLPKRTRYYSDLIDVHLLETGIDYEMLPGLAIIFILSYDPFGKGEMYYEIKSVFKSHPELDYDDGIRRIYLYTDGKLPENPDKYDIMLQNLLRYIRNSTDENVTDEDTRRLDEIVRSTKQKKDVGVKFMKSWEIERDLRDEGREEGRKEERVNTEAERRRADAEKTRADEAESRADDAESRADAAEFRAYAAEAELAKYKKKFGAL